VQSPLGDFRKTCRSIQVDVGAFEIPVPSRTRNLKLGPVRANILDLDIHLAPVPASQYSAGQASEPKVVHAVGVRGVALDVVGQVLREHRSVAVHVFGEQHDERAGDVFLFCFVDVGSEHRRPLEGKVEIAHLIRLGDPVLEVVVPPVTEPNFDPRPRSCRGAGPRELLNGLQSDCAGRRIGAEVDTLDPCRINPSQSQAER
jgi:hypothetical protein